MFKKLAVSAIAFTIILTPMMVKAEWVTVAETSKTTLSVDKKIILLDNKPTFFWEKLGYKEQRPNGVKEVVTYNEVNCNSIASRTHKIIFYDHDGEVIGTKEYEEVLNWEYPVPESVEEAILQKICK